MAAPWEKYRSAQPVLASPTDPLVAAEEARRQQDQEFEAQRIANDAARLRIAQQQAALQQQLGQMEVQQTQQDVVQSAEERGEEEQKATNRQIQQSLRSDSVLEALNIARRQIGEGYATGNFFGGDLWQGVPGLGQSSANLSATLSGIQGAIIDDTLQRAREFSASGASGYGNFTEGEAQRLAASVAALQQTQDEDALRTSLGRVERHYRNILALLNNEDPREPEVAERYGIISASEPTGGGDSNGPSGPNGDLTAQGRFESDPALRGINSRVEDMIREGRDPADIRSYLEAVRPGLGETVSGIDEAVSSYRQNPNREIEVDVENQWIPNSGAMQAIGEFGMSPMGSALIGAADTASLGFLDNLTSNPDMTRAVMSGVSEENPTSYLLGQIVGGAGSGLGIEAALARGGLGGITGARVGDALFGAGYGAGMADEPDDSRIASALLGAGSGVVGGALGRGAARTVGRGLTGVQNAAQQTLNRAGIRMTPGQILGGGVQRTEDRLAGLPVVGDAIQARRGEGLEDFNRAAFNQASEALGVPAPANIGGAGVDTLRSARSQRYNDLLDNQQFVPDQALEADIAALLAQSTDLPPALATDVTRSLEGRIGNAVQDIGGQDTITGRSFQRSLRGLDRDIRSLMKDAPVMGDVAEEAIRGGRTALLDMAGRQAPGVAEELARINRGNALMETTRAAVNTARNQGEVFTPAQLSSAAAIQARRFGNNQGTTQQPFYELNRAGQEVLPSQIPDSGTAGRMVLPLLAAGAFGGGGYATAEGDTAERAGAGASSAVIAALLASAPYSAAARDTLQKVLLSQRPQSVSRAGQALMDNSDIAGLLAAPATVGYVGQ